MYVPLALDKLVPVLFPPMCSSFKALASSHLPNQCPPKYCGAISKTTKSIKIQRIYHPQSYFFSSVMLRGVGTKMDDFLEQFQTAL